MQSVHNRPPPGNFTAWGDIPPRLRERLAAEGVSTFLQWRALGRKRLQIFGIVPSMVAQLDELARGARP